jgi:hypothetical protein
MCRDKVQKITEALYRVTEFFPDKEPLKWRLRSDAIEIFDFLFSSEDKKEIFDIENVLNLIRRIDRALQLASSFGAYMLSVNFEILRREYLSLADSLQNQFEAEKQESYTLESIKNILPASSFRQSPDNGFDSNGHSLTGELIDNGHNGHNGQDEKPAIKPITQKKEIKSSLKNTNPDNGQNPQPDEEQPILLKERKRKILNLIKENDWISTREIAASLKEFGEKSIQRDLLEMVGAGILKKTGDKRWRKYSLV